MRTREITQVEEQALIDCKKLHQALSLVSEAFTENSLSYRANFIDSLIDQELVIALQVLCSNLHEFDCSVPLQAYELLEEVGLNYLGNDFAQSLNLEANTWEILKPQVQS